MSAKTLALDLIRIDGGTQMRAAIDADTVAEYAAAWRAKAEFPALVVFFDGTDHWLADGFHRYHGAKAADRANVPVDVKQGTLREAILFAAGANGGLRRSNADKRKSVNALLADGEWGKRSSSWIAQRCIVSDDLVETVRRERQPSETKVEPRVGKDGKERKAPAPKKKPVAAPVDQPTAPPPAAAGNCPHGGDHDYDGDACSKCHDPSPKSADHLLRKDVKALKNGRATWSDKPIEEEIRKFVRTIDDFGGRLLTLFKDRVEIVGGPGAVAQAKLVRATEKMHDAANDILTAFNAWRHA